MNIHWKSGSPIEDNDPEGGEWWGQHVGEKGYLNQCPPTTRQSNWTTFTQKCCGWMSQLPNPNRQNRGSKWRMGSLADGIVGSTIPWMMKTYSGITIPLAKRWRQTYGMPTNEIVPMWPDLSNWIAAFVSGFLLDTFNLTALAWRFRFPTSALQLQPYNFSLSNRSWSIQSLFERL